MLTWQNHHKYTKLNIIRALVCLVPDGCHALCLKICLSLRTSTVYSRPLLGVLFQVVHPFHSPGTFSYLLCSALVAGTSLISARPQNNVTRKRQRDSDRLSIPLHTAGHLHAPNFFGGYQNLYFVLVCMVSCGPAVALLPRGQRGQSVTILEGLTRVVTVILLQCRDCQVKRVVLACYSVRAARSCLLP